MSEMKIRHKRSADDEERCTEHYIHKPKKHKKHKQQSADDEPVVKLKSKSRGKSKTPEKHRKLKKDKSHRHERDSLKRHKKSRKEIEVSEDSQPHFTDNHHVHVKTEEEFDRRQDELRRRRQERIQQHGPNGSGSSNNLQIKREPRDDTNGQERQHHDQRRIQNWERRQQTGDTENSFKDEEKPVEKEKPNLGLSGALTEDTNTYKGVVIKYNEPPEARIPKRKWRLYPFKGTESLKILHLHRQSAYLLGRQRRIADIPIDHPSCSKQHAVLQFRSLEREVNGVRKRTVRPYVIDLGSGNGTYVNNERIDAQRYVELKEKDVLKFGFSSREYVLLHAKSDTAALASDSSGSASED